MQGHNCNCKICGREIPQSFSYQLCRKHFAQQKEYGFFLDDNPRCSEDENEIILHEDFAEIILYNNITFDPIEETVKIDLDMVDKVKGFYWEKKQHCIIAKDKGVTIVLSNHLLDVDTKVEHLNDDYLDNRIENLKIIDKERKTKKIDRRRKGKVEITSIGTSTIDVTGSCWLVEYDKNDGTRGAIIIENGMNQGGTLVEDYNNNKRMIDYIPYDRADFMLFTHPHIDHIGLAPSCIGRGFKGEVIMTSELKTISEKLLLDSAFIHERNIKELRNKGKKPEIFYTESDVYLFLNRVKEIEKNEIIKLNNEVSIRLVNNSHTIGACQIELFIKKPSNHVVKILYTGDLGSKLNLEFQPFLQENEIVKKADIMICESTYGSSSRGFTKQECIDERKDLMKTLENTINKKSKCLIPSFSFSRSQTLMCMIYEHFKDSKDNFQIIVDSRLTNEINSAYREVLKDEEREYWNEVMAWERFKYLSSYKESIEVISKNDGIPRIIISSSGFMEAGHVRLWASNLMSNKDNTICFVGYGGVGTLADKIQNSKDPNITIDGVNCIRRCEIKTYHTFSSHIQQAEIINYFKQISIGSKILLHHGSTDAKHELKTTATKELKKIGKSVRIVVVEKGCDTFTI